MLSITGLLGQLTNGTDPIGSIVGGAGSILGNVTSDLGGVVPKVTSDVGTVVSKVTSGVGGVVSGVTSTAHGLVSSAVGDLGGLLDLDPKTIDHPAPEAQPTSHDSHATSSRKGGLLGLPIPTL